VIRRIATLAVVLVAALAGAAALLGASGPGPDAYRVDAIFDNADFLVPGQDVKIAGAAEGRVKEVRLEPDGELYRARVEMEVHPDFGPFRSDASCSIRPQSLIGEKFVDCDPGSLGGKPLETPDGATPTVPLENNHSPVDLDLVFATLRLPYRQRLTILVNELGTGLAGRPKELNEAIRRANPALQRANRVLEIVDSQRRTLGHLIDASDRVLAQLAARRGDVQGFIERADRVAEAVASRRGDLDTAIRRLPPMLDQLEPAARDLAALAEDARPVANDLRVAARPLGDLLGDFGPLTDAARPTLVALDELSTTGRRALRSTDPVAGQLLPIARRLPETTRLLRALTVSLRERGAVEGLLKFFYYAAAAASRFDRHSHILPSYQLAGTCQVYSETPTAGCDAHWGEDPATGPAPTPAKRQAKRGGKGGGSRERDAAPAPSTPATRDPRPATPEQPAQPAPPATPALPPTPTVPQVSDVLDYLLGP
jgi:ABC-type transporter Mla subunit MlaD